MYGAWLASPHLCGGLLTKAARQTLPSLTTARKFINMPMPQSNVLGKNYLPSRTSFFLSWKGAEPYTAEVQNIISYYQTSGHRFAQLNPLQVAEREQPSPPLKECNLDKVYTLPETTKIGGDESALPLREIVRRLESTYCSTIGVEYMHIDDKTKCDWIKGRFESPLAFQMTPEEKKALLYSLTDTTGVSIVLRSNWPKEKGYSLEGCDVLIPALQEIINQSSRRGVDSYIIGMPHRGRINVLANIFHIPLERIFCKFHRDSDTNDEGDVVYHLGTYSSIQNEASKRDIQFSLVANPSHAESVDPVVLGKTRALHFLRKDTEGETAMNILVHGDAAFSGQGVVYETLHLSTLPDYTTHGTIHFVINNQIHPQVARSSLNCTDVAKFISAPIFHVNADDPEAVIRVCRVAADWRATFKSDVLIDLVGYRRFGHPEVDELAVIRPTLNKEIENHGTVTDIYSAELIDSGVVIKEDYEAKRDDYQHTCHAASQNSKGMATSKLDWLDSSQEDLPLNTGHIPSTGIAESRINHIGYVYCTIPTHITPHSGIEGAFQKRLDTLMEKRECDWAMGEALAFGSLLEEGVHVRLSGQHVTTGIYSRRHHVIHDQDVESKQYTPLCHISWDQAQYTVCNSSLSEFAVLGFELGFSIGNPKSLVCWEAQFGDFHNTAQCIIDQYISSGEEKWARPNNLVLFLSHGYEGMGPEHSSARLERFLQLCADDADCQPDIDNPSFEYDQLYACNMQVINCTTPANYFHALRRQVKMPFRKPLIVMTLKCPWEHPSSISDMTEGTSFIRLIPDSTAPEGEGVRRVVFCSGKVYYELVKQREMADLTDTVAISRLEQISPFPYDLVDRELSRFPAAEIVWLQEEPKNMGAWSYVQPRFLTATGNKRSIRYIGRPPSAAVATGSRAVHKAEQDKLVNMAFIV